MHFFTVGFNNGSRKILLHCVESVTGVCVFFSESEGTDKTNVIKLSPEIGRPGYTNLANIWTFSFLSVHYVLDI